MEGNIERLKNEAEILAECQAILDSLTTDKFYRHPAFDAIATFGKTLQDKYNGRGGPTDFSEYRMHHLLGWRSGSQATDTRAEHKPAYFDFPGADSVEVFIRALSERLKRELEK